MDAETVLFYNDLAEYYHLIFEDWHRSIERQASVFAPLLEERLGPALLKILDCACGIGTQTIGLARLGHTVVASDVSETAVKRAEREIANNGLQVKFHVADMRDLSSIPESEFDAALAADNSLPHLLTDEDLIKALKNICTLLRSDGIFIATIRDYDGLLKTRPAFQGPAFYAESGKRRIIHQVWDWQGNQYKVHLYLTLEAGSTWETKHFTATYRALKRKELSQCLEICGFNRIEWLMPESTGFYQPIIVARKQPTRQTAIP